MSNGSLPSTSSTIGTSIAKGAAWLISLRLAVRAISFVNIIILARLLAPDDFGLIALATTIVAVFDTLVDFGFDIYLIRHQQATRIYYDTAWTMTILRNAFVAVGAVAVAPLAAAFFDDPRIEPVLWALAGVAFVFGFANVGIVDFGKHMKFHKEFVLKGCARLLAFFPTIAVAFVWQSYWALIVGIAANQLSIFVLSYLMHPFRPRLTLRVWREVFDYSKWVLLQSVGSFAYQKTDTFVVGRVLDAQSLGMYTVAWEVANIATGEVGGPIRRAILPGYAKLAHELTRLRKTYLDVFSVTALVLCPIAAIILVCAEPLVVLLLGNQWIDAIPLVEILAVGGLIRAMNPSANELFMAIGKPHLVSITMYVTLLIAAPAIVLATIRFGLPGTAWALVASAAIQQGIVFALARRHLGVAILDHFRKTWRTIASVSALILCTRSLDSSLSFDPDLLSQTARLATLGLTSLSTMMAVQVALWVASGRPPGGETLVAAGVLRALRRIRGS